MNAHPLAGRNIGVPETRQLDVLVGLLQRRGANVTRCPLVSIHDTEQPEQVRCWLDSYIQNPFDDLILLTGEGLRRLLSFAERFSWRAEFVAALSSSRKIVRGPKPAKALRELGLKPDVDAVAPTTQGVIETLRGFDLYDRRIGVQLYGQEPNLPLRVFLDQAGAHDFFVAPYRYADASEDQQVLELIDKIAGDELDALCFTSSPQIRRLLSVARKHQREKALREALARMVIAAVGPVVAQALTDESLPVNLMPDDSYFMKPLVQSMVNYWHQ